MSWGDFKRSVGLNTLNTRSTVAKVAKVIPGAALAVPSKKGLANAAVGLQQYGGVAKAALSGDLKGALGKAKDAAKYAASATKGSRVSAPAPIQVQAPVGAYAEKSGMGGLQELSMGDAQRQAAIGSTNTIALAAMLGVIVIAAIVKGARK